MPWGFIVAGLLALVAGAWTAGDERVSCQAITASEGSSPSKPAADCTIQVRSWGGARVSPEQLARGVEDFRVTSEEHKASDPYESPRTDYAFEMVTSVGSRYRVEAAQDEVDTAALAGRHWLSNGMAGEYLVVFDRLGRASMAGLIGFSCLGGGLVGLWRGRARGNRRV